MSASTITTYLAALTTQAVVSPCQSTVQTIVGQTLFWGLNNDYGRTNEQDYDIPIGTCYPPKYAKDGLYSPGICPSGWTSACTLGADFPYPEATYSIKLKSDTTGIVCCPSYFTCDTANTANKWTYAYCASSFQAAQNSVFIPTYTSGVTDTITAAGRYTWLGKPVLVAYQSTDSVALAFFEHRTLTSSSPSSSISSASSASPAKSSAPASTTQTSSPLPFAAKVTIGALVPVVVILALLSGWLVLRYRRKRLGERSNSVHRDEIAQAPFQPVYRDTGHYYDEPIHEAAASRTAGPRSPQRERYELSDTGTGSSSRPMGRSELGNSSISNDRSRVS